MFSEEDVEDIRVMRKRSVHCGMAEKFFGYHYQQPKETFCLSFLILEQALLWVLLGLIIMITVDKGFKIVVERWKKRMQCGDGKC